MGLLDGVMGNASKIDASKIQEEFARILMPGDGVEPGQGQAARSLGCVQAAKAQLAGLGDGLLGEDAFGVPVRRMRRELGPRKVAGRLGKGALFFGELKVHGVCLAVVFVVLCMRQGFAGLSMLSQRINPLRRSCVSRVRHSW